MGCWDHQFYNKIPLHGDKVPYSAAAIFSGYLQSPGETGGSLYCRPLIKDVPFLLEFFIFFSYCTFVSRDGV